MSKAKNYFILGLVFCFSLTVLSELANAQAPASEQNSRLVVSFYSICCGTDRKAQDKLDRFISGYERSRRKHLANSKVGWGREGEIDYCLSLSNLSTREQKRFTNQVKSLLKKSKLVHITENVPCKQPR